VAVVLAIDVGGTKLAAGVVDGDARILSRARVPSPHGTDAEELYEALIACCAAALRGADTLPGDLGGIGVSCAGPMVWPAGEVSPLNMPAWRGFPLRERLLGEFQANLVRIHNDAVGIAVGEHWKGAGAGTRDLLGLTVSTGVGGGLILDGHLYHGTSGNAGHFGHIIVEPDGPPCACGGRGCVEAIAAGPNTVKRALAEGWQPDEGSQADGIGLAASAAGGDPIAIRNLGRAGRAVGIAIASSTHLLDLEMVAIDGGFSQSGPPFWDALRQAFATHARMKFATACEIVPGTLGSDAPLLGAAAFILDPDRYGWAVPTLTQQGAATVPSPETH
jgi:glucokinase